MLGLTKREIQNRFDDIVDFAELREFIDAPVKTYSSGMYMRLGFAVAIHVDPDVLLVDEVLAVGDEGFTHKCLDKFGEFKRRGKTILLVTHSLGLVERFCDEAVWLDAGEKKAQGDTTRVIGAYVSDVAKQEEKLLASSDQRTQQSVADAPPLAEPPLTVGDASADMTKAAEGRWGSGAVTISDVRLTDPQGLPAHVFMSGAPVVLRFKVHARAPVTDFAFGIGLFNADGVWVYGTNTDVEHFEADELRGDNEVALQFHALNLVEGTYKLDLAVHKADGAPYDYHRLLYTFRVKSRIKDVGIYRPHHTWKFSDGIRFKPPAHVDPDKR
jgi:lipopolysaccharide transport system ATP-binding protein